MLREQCLVGSHDAGTGGEGVQNELSCWLDATHHFDDDLGTPIGDERGQVVSDELRRDPCATVDVHVADADADELQGSTDSRSDARLSEGAKVGL